MGRVRALLGCALVAGGGACARPPARVVESGHRPAHAVAKASHAAIDRCSGGAAAREAERLEAEGRIDRAARVLAAAAPGCGDDALARRLEADLASGGDPASLDVEARAAEARGDLVASRRSRDVALRARERAAGATASVEWADAFLDPAFAAWSRDGALVAIAARDDVVILDARSMRELRRLRGHAKPVRAVAFDPASRRVASAGEDGRLVVHDVRTGAVLRTFQHPAQLYAVRFSADGARVVVHGPLETCVLDAQGGAPARCVSLGEAKGEDPGRVVRALDLHPVSLVALAPDLSAAMVAERSGRVRAWNLETGDALVEIPGDARVRSRACTALSPGARALAFVEAGALRVQTFGDDRARTLPLAKAEPCTALAYSHDGARLAVAHGGAVDVLDAATGAPVAHLQVEGQVTGVGFGPNDAAADVRWSKTTGGDTTWADTLFDARGGAAMLSREELGAWAVAPDARRAVTFAGDARYDWSAETRRTDRVPLRESLRAPSISGDGRTIAAATLGDTRLVRRGEGGARAWSVPVRGDARLAEDGATLASASPDEGDVRVSSSADGKELRRIAAGDGKGAIGRDEVVRFAIDAGGARVATWRTGGAIHLRDLASGRELRALEMPGTEDSPIEDVRFARDATRAAVVREHALSIVSLADGAEVGSFDAEHVQGALFLGDGSFVYAAGEDRAGAAGATPFTVLAALTAAVDTSVAPDCRSYRVDPAKGLMKRELVGCHGLDASGDGARVVLAEPSGAHVWEIATGLALPAFAPGVRLTEAALSHDGRVGVAAAEDGTLRVWRVDDGAPVGTFFFVPGKDAVVVRAPDGDVTLLGDAAAAREALVCRVGGEALPFEACAGRFVRE